MLVWRQCALGIKFIPSFLPGLSIVLSETRLAWNKSQGFVSSWDLTWRQYFSVSYERGRPFGKEVGNQNWALFVKLKFLFKGRHDTLINQSCLTTSHCNALKQESFQMQEFAHVAD